MRPAFCVPYGLGAMQRPAMSGSPHARAPAGAAGRGLRSDRPVLRARDVIDYVGRQWVLSAPTGESHDVRSLLGDGGCSARAIVSAERQVEQAAPHRFGRDGDALLDARQRLRHLPTIRGSP
jgi:hypothetical protein